MSSPQPNPDRPTGHIVASRREKALAMGGISLSGMMVALDATIISTSMPTVAQALNGMDLYSWVGTGYFLSLSATILIFGRLGDMYGRKPMMMASLALVALFSLLCGVSQSMTQLIVFRIIQGIGGGMMIATSFAAPADLFPDARQRVKWMALVTMGYGLANSFGPLVGGVITESFGWRSTFMVIPVVGLTATYMIWKYFPRLHPAAGQNKKIDCVGGSLIMVSIACLLVGIELLSGRGAIGIDAAIGLIVIGMLLAGLLFWVEKQVRNPIFPLRIVMTRESRLLNMASMISGGIMFILIFYVPLLLQDVFNHTPKQAGLLMTPLVAGIPLGSIINGRLYPRQNEPQRLMLFGSIMMATGCLGTLLVSASSPDWLVLVSLALAGLGLGFLLPNFTLGIQVLSAKQDIGVASALIQTTRALGSAIGMAATGLLIAKISISGGLRISLAIALALSLVTAWMVMQIQMRNVTTR